MQQTDRRGFLKRTAAFAGALAMESAAPVAAEPAKPAPKLRGVNLGGWLALEKWMAPGPYAGSDAPDEYTLCESLGKKEAISRLKRHRESWITAEDFQWIAERGLNTVRIPIGYGVAEENPPFVTGLDTLDWAFRTAASHNIGILLDLHGVPGSQNGWDHSGRQGALGWHTSRENIAHSVRIVERLAQFCKGYSNLIGLELLNEPRWDVPIDILKSYYQDAYAVARQHLPRERTAIVIHDGFRAFDWANFMQEPAYSNVLLDTHLYQCYTEEDRKHDIHAHVEIAVLERKRMLDRMRQQLDCIVGEWSCALDPHSLQGLDPFQQDVAFRAYGAAQLASFETTRGWFFWSYKVEGGGGWSFRDCVHRGWMPDRYNIAAV